MQRINVDIVANGAGWHLRRLEVARTPLIGGLIRTGPTRQLRFVESGGLAIGTSERVAVHGPGHRVEAEAGVTLLYVPVSPLVEWVLAFEDDVDPTDLPAVEHSPPPAEPVAIPFADTTPPGLYPEWASTWLSLPSDVATWASCLDIRATSLSQRTGRLAGATPKQILNAVRASLAFELAEYYRGHGAQLALDAGYSSQAHLSADMSARFGMSLSVLMSDRVSEELAWLRLLRSTVR